MQPLTRAKTAALGEPGARWVEELPARLDRLARSWRLELARSLPGGSTSYVCRARRRDASGADRPVVIKPVVIKVAGPGEDLTAQAGVLRRAAGRGYVGLLGFDEAENALLMEDLGASLVTSGASVDDQLRTLADTLMLAWQPVADAPELDRGLGKAAGLAAGIEAFWSQLDHPCPRSVVDRALAEAAWLAAHSASEPVVVHGDPHPQNLLAVPAPRAGAETGYVFVDPEGFVEDRGYDLGVAMRDFCGRLLAAEQPQALVERWARLLGERTGVDVERIQRWAFLERVSTGLYVLSFGADRVGRPFLESAARLLG